MAFFSKWLNKHRSAGVGLFRQTVKTSTRGLFDKLRRYATTNLPLHTLPDGTRRAIEDLLQVLPAEASDFVSQQSGKLLDLGLDRIDSAFQ